MTIFMTGFPGFIGRTLLPRVLARTGGDAVCLVQQKYADTAEQRLAELVADERELDGRIRLVEGDITRPGLGLGDPDGQAGGVTEVWHLAAVYDLAVPRDLGMRVNVDGTRNVLEFTRRCRDLDRLHYVSTCYVSGRFAGAFREDDLERAGPFNNFYEETKHLAERDVRAEMAKGLPATIYRPAIVVGDSVTGHTQKFDGPYFLLQWLLRQRRIGVVPVVGDPAMVTLNVVPVDFVIDAVSYLSGLPQSSGRTYQLADPEPLTVEAMTTLLGEATGTRLVRVPVPRRLAKAALRHVPGAYRVLRIPAETVDYFVHPTSYLTDHASADLAGAGITVPRFEKYVDQLVDFMRAHPEIGHQPMV
jgi:thioester reductase-like protein